MRYFFHFLAGDERLDDDVGAEHADFGTARTEALRAARELIAESLRQNLPLAEDGVIEITDACGALVGEVSLIGAAFGATADRRYRHIFEAVPQGSLVLTTGFVIVDANAAFLRARRTELSAIAGRLLFDVFPDNPGAGDADGVRNLIASLQIVLRDKVAHELPVQRQDIRRRDGGWDERYWKLRNVPVLDADGHVAFLVHQAEDVTDAAPGALVGREVSRPAP
jgi:PAS domain-containing protein